LYCLLAAKMCKVMYLLRYTQIPIRGGEVRIQKLWLTKLNVPTYW
jgi:hypothetical protein